MIVCVCARVSEKDIKKLLPCEVEDVMIDTGAAMQCGKCFECLKQIVKEEAPVR